MSTSKRLAMQPMLDGQPDEIPNEVLLEMAETVKKTVETNMCGVYPLGKPGWPFCNIHLFNIENCKV